MGDEEKRSCTRRLRRHLRAPRVAREWLVLLRQHRRVPELARLPRHVPRAERADRARLRARVVTEQHWARYGAAVGLDDFGGETELDTFAQACNPRRPADNLTFALASFVLQLRLLVLVSPQEMYDTAELVREDAPVALIAWLDRVHFEPIVSRVARPLPPCAAAVARSLRALADAGAEETGPEVDAAVEPSARGAVGLLNPADPIVGALLELRRAK